MESVRHYIKSFTYLGLGLIGLLLINSILFTHSQTLADGSVVVHAHPYNKSDNAPINHNHHDDELLILANIALLFFTAALSFAFKKQLVNLDDIDFQQIKYIDILLFRKLGRAPPVY